MHKLAFWKKKKNMQSAAQYSSSDNVDTKNKLLWEYHLDESAISLLQQLIGSSLPSFYAIDVGIRWGVEALAWCFSLHLEAGQQKWLVFEADIWGDSILQIEYSFIKIFASPNPKDVPYVSTPDGGVMLKGAMSDISFSFAPIKTISILEGTWDLDEGRVCYDHSVLFCFEDGKQALLTAELSPTGLLIFSVEQRKIDEAVKQFRQRVILQ